MPELLVVGEHRNPYNQLELKRFQEFHDYLLGNTEDDTTIAMMARLNSTAGIHIETLLFPSSKLARRTAIMSHTLSAIAETHHEVHQGLREYNPLGIGWLIAAKLGLELYVDGADLTKDTLRSSIFFSGEIKKLKEIGRHSLRYVTPSGFYQPYAFVVGVATGELKVQFPSDASFQNRAKKTSAA